MSVGGSASSGWGDGGRDERTDDDLSQPRQIRGRCPRVYAGPTPTHLLFSDLPSCKDPQGPLPAGAASREPVPLPGAGVTTAARLSCRATVWPLRGSPLPGSSLGSVQSRVSRKEVQVRWPRAQWRRVSSLKLPKDVSTLNPSSSTRALARSHRRPAARASPIALRSLSCRLYEEMTLLCHRLNCVPHQFMWKSEPQHLQM